MLPWSLTFWRINWQEASRSCMFKSKRRCSWSKATCRCTCRRQAWDEQCTGRRMTFKSLPKVIRIDCKRQLPLLLKRSLGSRSRFPFKTSGASARRTAHCRQQWSGLMVLLKTSKAIARAVSYYFPRSITWSHPRIGTHRLGLTMVRIWVRSIAS